MSFDKAQFPIRVLRALKNAEDQFRKNKVKVTSTDDILMKAVDTRLGERFYFLIKDYLHEGDKLKLKLEFFPHSIETLGVADLSSGLDISPYITSWIKLCDEYHDTKFYFDEAERAFEKEFAQILSLNNKSKEDSYFSFQQQIVLNKAIDNLVHRIDRSEEISAPEKENILDVAEDAKEAIKTGTQKESIGWVAKIFAKVRKCSPTLCAELLKAFLFDCVIDAAQAGIDINKAGVIAWVGESSDAVRAWLDALPPP